MKTISLWQPWASLVATNWKHYETRSWSTNYRGPLLIHAAKHTDDLEYWFNQPKFKEHLQASGIAHWIDLPRGAIIAAVKLVSVIPTEHIRHRLSSTELAFGNYEDGRFAWELEFGYRFVSPIPYRGAQGLFDCNFELPISLEDLHS